MRVYRRDATVEGTAPLLGEVTLAAGGPSPAAYRAATFNLPLLAATSHTVVVTEGAQWHVFAGQPSVPVVPASATGFQFNNAAGFKEYFVVAPCTGGDPPPW